MKNPSKETELLNVMMEEPQMLPQVAEHLSMINVEKVDDKEVKELIIKAKRYLNLLFDTAIQRLDVTKHN